MEKKDLVILMISSDRRLFKTGSSVSLRMMALGSRVRELHIIVFTHLRDGHRAAKLSDRVFLYPTNSLSKWFYPLSALAIGRKIKPGVGAQFSLITAQDPFEAGWVATRLAKFFRTRLELQVHTDVFSPFFSSLSTLNKIRVFLARRLLPMADSVRVVSKRIRDSLLTGGVVEGVRIEIIPVFTDLSTREEATVEPVLREKFPDFKFIILMVGRLSPEKNISGAISVFREVLSKYPFAGLVIIGDGEERERLEEEAAGFKSVVFVGWADDPSLYYQGANMFLSTSFYEGYGLSLLEAAASGLPIVSTDVGVVGEMLIPGQELLACPVGSKKCLVNSVIRIIENNGLREELATNAKIAAGRGGVTIDNFADKVSDFWRRAVS